MENTSSIPQGPHQQPSPRPDSHPVPDGSNSNSAKSKIEQQIVLRLPERLAAEVRKRIAGQSLTNASISIHPIDDRNVIFRVEGMGDYPGTLVDLPCIIESLKTWDGAAYYKSADICQMLIVREIGDTEVPPIEYPSGLAPPTAHIRERRFRKPQLSKEEIQQAESHLWNILQGQPQVHYELIEEEVEIDEEAEEEQEEEFESGDEWEEEEEDDSKWRASTMTGDTASMIRGTPMSEPQETPMSSTRFTPGHDMMSPGRFAVPSTGPHIRQSTPSMFPASVTSSVNQGLTPDAPFGRPLSTPGFVRQASSSSVSNIPSLQPTPAPAPQAPPQAPPLLPKPFAQPQPLLPSPTTSTPRATSMDIATELPAELPSPAVSEGISSAPVVEPAPAEGTPMLIDEPDLDKEKSGLRQRLESEIVELQARIEDLTSKSQTTNKILKKRFTKNLEEAQQTLEQKKSELAAL